MASSIINNIDDYLASDGLIYFDKINNAYYVVDGHSGNCIQIEYCPWCGQRLMSIKADDHKNIFTIFEKDAGNYKRKVKFVLLLLVLLFLLSSLGCQKTPGGPMGRIIADQSHLSESKEAENNLAFKTVYNKKEIYINEEGDHRISQGYDLYCYNGKLNNQKVYFFFDDNVCVSFAVMYYDHTGKKTSVYYRGSNKEIDSLTNSAVINGEVLKCITDSLQNNKKFYLYHFGSESNIYVVFESGEFYLIDGVELGMKIEFPDNISPEYSQITLF